MIESLKMFKELAEKAKQMQDVNNKTALDAINKLQDPKQKAKFRRIFREAKSGKMTPQMVIQQLSSEIGEDTFKDILTNLQNGN